jgi:phosphoribulokinase
MIQRRGNGWMDGYRGEELLLIDEIRPGSVDYPWLLQMLDNYDVSAEVKGGRVSLKNLR